MLCKGSIPGKRFFLREASIAEKWGLEIFWGECPKISRFSDRYMSYNYEGHPINRGNFLIMQEFVPLEQRKCNH